MGLKTLAQRLKQVTRVRTRYRKLRAPTATLGILGAWRFRQFRLREAAGAQRHPYALAVRHVQPPMIVRGGTSDLDVFFHVFVQREYQCVDSLRDVRSVIDCGANVGYASAYFLSRWPQARVLALEPDHGNFAALSTNLKPYGDRVTLLQAGLWSGSCDLAIAEAPFRDGRQWARQVRVATTSDTVRIPAVSMDALIARTGRERVSLLKIDIEGAEVELFSGDVSWLDRVDNMVVELHEDSAFGPSAAIFEQAIRGRGFAVTRFGELTVCRR